MPVKLSGPMLPPDAGGAPRTLVVLLHGFRVIRHVSPGAGHTIAPDGLDFATAFIAGLPAAP